MKRYPKFIVLENKVDFLSILLVLLVFLFAGTLSYFLTFVRHAENSILVQQHVHRLQGIHHALRQFGVLNNEFINFDTINANIKEFHDNLSTLNTKLNKLSSQPEPLLLAHRETVEVFERYENRLEYFKTVHAASQNAFFQLRLLRETLLDKPALSAPLKLEVAKISLLLSSFDHIQEQSTDFNSLCDTAQGTEFALYLERFCINAEYLIGLLKNYDIQSLNEADARLKTQLHLLETLAAFYYDENLQAQKRTTYLFFALVLGLLGLILLAYRRTVQARKSLQAFRYAVENSESTVVITTPDREIVYANSAFEKATGYTLQEALGQNPSILKSGKHDPSYYTSMNEMLDRGEKWQGEFINKRKDGKLFYEKASIVPILLDKKLINYLAIKLDVTNYVEQNLRLQEFASVFESIEEAVIITDEHHHIRHVNQAFAPLYGCTPELAKGRSLFDFLPTNQHITCAMKKAKEAKAWSGKLEVKVSNDTTLPLWTTIKVIENNEGDIVSYVLVQTDIQEIVLLQEKAEHQAKHDSLTGLLNRRGFEEIFTQYLKRAQTSGKSIGLAFLDLDKFKPINDTYGHDTGDVLLKLVAKRIQNSLRKGDIVARFGGDEFILLLDNLNDAKEAIAVLDRTVKAFSKTFLIKGIHVETSPSIGVAFYPEHGNTYEALVKKADEAMYKAKELGKNQFFIYK